jgi:hypothetical protein
MGNDKAGQVRLSAVAAIAIAIVCVRQCFSQEHDVGVVCRFDCDYHQEIKRFRDMIRSVQCSRGLRPAVMVHRMSICRATMTE